MYGQPVAQPAYAVAQPAYAVQAAPQFYGAQTAALQAWFQQVDTDRSGRISTQELQKALQMGGLNFSLKLVASLVRMHDVSKTMSLDFQEFCNMQTYLTKLQQTFSQFAAGQPQIHLQQIQAALGSLGFTVRARSMNSACAVY